MHLKQLERRIDAYFNSGLCVELIGPPGVGKSDFVKHLRDLFSERDGFEWGLGIAFLATYTPIDLMGYMMANKKTLPQPDGTMVETMVSEFTMPPWMLSIDGKPLNSYRKSILFMDEYDKGEPDVKKTAAELFLHGQIGSHRLGSHVHRIAASNRARDRSGSTKSFDFVINRRAELQIEPDFKSWEEWAFGAGMEPIFVLFAKKFSNIVFGADVPKDQGPWCTPRSYAAAVRLLNNHVALLKASGTHVGNYTFDEPTLGAETQEMLTGVIGEAAATQLAGWLRVRLETPDFEQIIKDPAGTGIPNKPDAKMLTCYECSHNVNRASLAAVIKYIKRFDQEFHITFAKGACKKDHTLITAPEMREFIKGNQALMLAIS